MRTSLSRRLLSKCTVQLANGKRPPRVVISGALFGLVYHLEKAVHSDGLPLFGSCHESEVRVADLITQGRGYASGA
jgi:hypothetical protein